MKHFYMMKKISKEEYLKLMNEAGQTGEEKWINRSSGGACNIDKKTTLGYYTVGEGVEVPEFGENLDD